MPIETSAHYIVWSVGHSKYVVCVKRRLWFNARQMRHLAECSLL